MSAAVPAVTGEVTYDVRVTCPHCGDRLYLNQYPYNNDRTEYYLPDDPLGRALFGSTTQPAGWENMRIDYTCCHDNCRGQFCVDRLEY